MTVDNPLLSPWTTRFGEPPFSKVELAHFPPAFDAAIAEWRQEIEAIKADRRPPDFDNVILALERSGQALDRVERVFFHLVGAASGDEIEAIQREIQPPPRPRIFADVARRRAIRPGRCGSFGARRARRRGDAARRAALARLQARRRRVAGGRQAAACRDRRTARFARSELFAERARRREGVRAGAGAATPISRACRLRRSQRRPRRPRSGAIPAPGRSRCRARRSSRSCSSRRGATCASRSGAPSSTRGGGGERDNGPVDERNGARCARNSPRSSAMPSFADYKLADTMAGTPRAALDLMDRVWTPARAAAREEAKALQAMIAEDGGNFEIATLGLALLRGEAPPRAATISTRARSAPICRWRT